MQLQEKDTTKNKTSTDNLIPARFWDNYDRLGSQKDVLNILKFRLKEVIEKNIKIVILLGLARSGTTILQMILSQLPEIKSTEYQPIKDIYRRERKNKSTGFTNIPPNLGENDYIFIKETLGVDDVFECSMDPIELLIKAGVHPQNIHTIYLLRDPNETLNSWKKFSHTSVDYYKLSLISLLNSYQKHKDIIKLSIPFSYDQMRNNPTHNLSILLNKLMFDVQNLSLEINHNKIYNQKKNTTMKWNEAEDSIYWDEVIQPMIYKNRLEYIPPLKDFPNLTKKEIAYIKSEFFLQYLLWQQLCISI